MYMYIDTCIYSSVGPIHALFMGLFSMVESHMLYCDMIVCLCVHAIYLAHASVSFARRQRDLFCRNLPDGREIFHGFK